MVLQVEHTVQHYTSYCQEAWKGIQNNIQKTAFFHFMIQELCAAMGKNTVYQNASWYK